MRVIVDAASETLPGKAIQALFEPTHQQNATVIGKLRKRFKRDPELLPWETCATQAAVNMNRFLASVIRRLAEKINRTRI